MSCGGCRIQYDPFGRLALEFARVPRRRVFDAFTYTRQEYPINHSFDQPRSHDMWLLWLCQLNELRTSTSAGALSKLSLQQRARSSTIDQAHFSVEALCWQDRVRTVTRQSARTFPQHPPDTPLFVCLVCLCDSNVTQVTSRLMIHGCDSH